MFVPAFAGHGTRWMGQSMPLPCKACTQCAHEAEAHVVVAVVRVVPVAVRRAAVPGVVVPAAAPVDAVGPGPGAHGLCSTDPIASNRYITADKPFQTKK